MEDDGEEKDSEAGIPKQKTAISPQELILEYVQENWGSDREPLSSHIYEDDFSWGGGGSIF